MLTESVKKVTGGNKGDPTRPLGEKPTKSRENLPEASLGPRHASRCIEEDSTSRLLAERERSGAETEKKWTDIQTDRLELELSRVEVGIELELS